jgi:isoleucyl-tRNA synthetase
MWSRRSATTSFMTSIRRCTTSVWWNSAVFYLDIIKDRLYTTGAGSVPRRSAQTAMYHVANAMVRWLAPILSFTAEEVWSFLPGTRNESVFLNTWHRFPAGAERTSGDRLAGVHRTEGGCGPRTRTIAIGGRDRRAARSGGDDFRAARAGGTLSSAARRIAVLADHQPSAGHRSRYGARGCGADSREGVWIEVKPSSQPKCVRCWHLRSDVGSDPSHPELCARCVVNVEGPGEERKFA